MMLFANLAILLLGNEEPTPTVEVVRNSYISTVSAIFTIDCEMQLEFEHVKPDPLKSASVRYDGARVHLWRKGSWRALYSESIDGNHEPATAVWRGFDGTLYGRWTKSLRPIEQQESLPGGMLQAEKDNNLYEYFTIDRLTGETLSAGDLPLGVLLADPEAKIVGRRIIGGASCLEISFPRHMAGRKYPNLKNVETTVWLDPAQFYLPRLIRRTIYPMQDTDPPQVHEFETTEFGKIVGDDQQSYTLPVAGENRNSVTKTRLKLLRATINGPIPDQIFKPTYPDKAEVLKTLPNQPPERIVIGPADEHQRAHDAFIEKARQRKGTQEQSTTKNGLPPSASPKDAGGWMTSRWWSYLAGTTVVGAFVVGVRAWRARN
jgi:hypothetical protein